MEIQKVKGDIVDTLERGETNVIIHGCNCFHTMGSGVAKALNEATNGRLLEADKRTPHGDINKLGEFSSTVYNGVNIFNLYTQHGYGRDSGATYIYWDSFESGMLGILMGLEIYQPEDKIISIPYIGCGLAGGEEKDFWERIETIEGVFDDVDFVLQVIEYEED